MYFYVLVAALLVLGYLSVQPKTYEKRDKNDEIPKFVRVQQKLPVLEVAEIQIYDRNNLNVAPLKRAGQSSVKNNDVTTFGPNIVINGNINGWADGELATTCISDSEPWLEIDLIDPTILSRITVFLRDKQNFPNPNPNMYSTLDKMMFLEVLNKNRQVIEKVKIPTNRAIYDYNLRYIN